MFTWIERLLGNQVIQEASGSLPDRDLTVVMDRAMVLVKTGRWVVKKRLHVYGGIGSYGYRIVLRRKNDR